MGPGIVKKKVLLSIRTANNTNGALEFSLTAVLETLISTPQSADIWRNLRCYRHRSDKWRSCGGDWLRDRILSTGQKREISICQSPITTRVRGAGPATELGPRHIKPPKLRVSCFPSLLVNASLPNAVILAEHSQVLVKYLSCMQKALGSIPSYTEN